MDTKKLRQKILDLAIRGKLVPQDPNDEPASVLLERIRAEKERLIKEGKIKRSKKSISDTNENEIPDGWVCCRFDEICSKFSTGPFGSMVHKSDYVSQNGTPIVNPMNIVDGEIVTNNLMMVSDEKAQELNRYRLSKGDILIARRGDLRKCCIVTEKSVDWLCGTGSFFLHVPFVEPRYIELLKFRK
jgi:type I restriction enzyme S subunit